MGQPKNRGIIGILTGGGDVPGLNPAIRAVTIRALRYCTEVSYFRFLSFKSR